MVKQNIMNFLGAAYVLQEPALRSGKTEGCHYKMLDHDLAIVVAADIPNEEIRVKIAFNLDDMQCDYEDDWGMPYDPESGDVYDTDVILGEGDWEVIAIWLLAEYRKISRLRAAKKLVCSRII